VGARITNNYVEATAQISIEVFGHAPDAVIQGNTTVGGEMGISVDTSDRTQVTGNKVTADPKRLGYFGLEVAGASNVTVSGNTVDGSNVLESKGVVVSNTSPLYNVVTKNTIYRTVRGVQINRGADHNTVSYNTIDTYSLFGIELAGDAANITQNVITNGGAGATGVMVDGSANDQITYNTIHGAAVAVSLYGGNAIVDYDTITDNRFESCATAITQSGAIGSHNVIARNYVGP